jgi:hypothetical protein
LPKEVEMKKCIYCSTQLSEESLIDFCDNCGRRVFGDNLYEAILDNMKAANKRGDLDQGGGAQAPKRTIKGK